MPRLANVPQSEPGGEPWNLLAAVDGEEIGKTNADEWHADGITGAGIKVGIVDYFDSGWAAAKAAGEVPTEAGFICRNAGANCAAQMFASGSDHGTAVAEIVHEMAPGAQLYLATVSTTADLQAAVNYFDLQGVHIITRSLTSEYDGAGDGSGPIAEVIQDAVNKGMAWFNSAGNSAERVSGEGAYWRGTWTDTDGDNFMEFAPASGPNPPDEFLGFVCSGFMNGLRWDDWEPDATDYDMYVYNSIGIGDRPQRQRPDAGRRPDRARLPPVLFRPDRLHADRQVRRGRVERGRHARVHDERHRRRVLERAVQRLRPGVGQRQRRRADRRGDRPGARHDDRALQLRGADERRADEAGPQRRGVRPELHVRSVLQRHQLRHPGGRRRRRARPRRRRGEHSGDVEDVPARRGDGGSGRRRPRQRVRPRRADAARLVASASATATSAAAATSATAATSAATATATAATAATAATSAATATAATAATAATTASAAACGAAAAAAAVAAAATAGRSARRRSRA